jgi:hypothetical protein
MLCSHRESQPDGGQTVVEGHYPAVHACSAVRGAATMVISLFDGLASPTA